MREIPPPGAKRRQVELSRIRTDGDTQSRVNIDPSTVEDYTEDLKEGAEFPPAVVFFDGKTYWLASGFHRVEAHRQASRKTIDCYVGEGSVADARFYAASCNADHGVRRTAADKRRAVLLVLADARTQDWTAAKIADYCGVSSSFVRAMQAAQQQMGVWKPRAGLFGPDELQTPPSPAARLAEKENASGTPSSAPAPAHVGKQEDEDDADLDLEEHDRVKILERARRTWAKLVRFAGKLHTDVDALVAVVRVPVVAVAGSAGDNGDTGDGCSGADSEGEALSQ